jgi:hypothetical protein
VAVSNSILHFNLSENIMSHEAQTTLSGEATDIFAHRFVIKTATGKILADLGPKGAERVALSNGDLVKVSGEMKPPELKVYQITKQGGAPIDIEHNKKPHEREHQPDADPEAVIRAARNAGFAIIGGPKRGAKAFRAVGSRRRWRVLRIALRTRRQAATRHASRS